MGIRVAGPRLRLLRRGQGRRGVRPRRGDEIRGAGRHVAFLHVEGSPGRAALELALARTAGIERGTARISADLLTVSFAYDPRRAALGAIHSSLEKRLGTSLLPFRVIEKPGDLKEVKR